MQLGDRLREERERLGMTQEEMATACATSKRSYCAYESGETQPKADFLAAFAGARGDVLYVLTGQRAASALEPDEAALLDNYRHTNQNGKAALQTTSAALAREKNERKTG